MKTGPGPYRRVADKELRDIFYLTPQTGKALGWFTNFIATTTPPPGTDQPVVTEILRAFLYIHASPTQTMELRRVIETRLTDRNSIAIRAKLLSLMRLVREKPWAFPACLSERQCRQYYGQLKPIQEKSEIAADTLGDPLTGGAADAGLVGAMKKAKRFTTQQIATAASQFGMLVGLTNYFGGQSADYYEFYMRRISDELALRGIPPSSL